MDKLLVSVEEAARRLSIGRSLAYELIASGQLPRVKIGRRTLVPTTALAEWVNRMASATALATEKPESANRPANAATRSEVRNR